MNQATVVQGIRFLGEAPTGDVVVKDKATRYNTNRNPVLPDEIPAPQGRLGSVEEEVLGKAYDGRLMRRLMGYMKPYRPLVALSLVFLLAQSFFQVLGPLLTRIAVDRYLQPNAASVPSVLNRLLPADPWTGLTRIGLMYLTVLAGVFTCEFVADGVLKHVNNGYCSLLEPK